MPIDNLISIQSTGPWRMVFECLANALPIYKKNASRPPVSRPENIECSAAIILLIVSLESHIHRLMYFEPQQLDTGRPLSKKIKAYLPEPTHKCLLEQMDEVTVCRDAVTHALVWNEERKSDANGSIVSQTWKIAPITAPRPKLEKCVDLAQQPPTSRLLAMNVVPTNVDVVDVAKALIVVCRLMRELERKYDNPKAWIGLFPSAEHLVPTFVGRHTDDSLETWIAGLLRQLHPHHLQDVQGRLGVTRVRVNGDIEFSGLSRYQ